MSGLLTLLGGIELNDLRTLQRTSPGRNGVGLVLAAVGVVVAAAIFWALFIRKRRDSAAGRYREHFSAPSEPNLRVAAANGAPTRTGSRRKRKRRREHRQRNPTLAETGGLPPIREDLQSQDDPP